MRDGLLAYDAGTHIQVRQRDPVTQTWLLLGTHQIGSASFAGVSVGSGYVGMGASTGYYSIFGVHPSYAHAMDLPLTALGSPEVVDDRLIAHMYAPNRIALIDLDCQRSVVSTRMCEQNQRNSRGFRARLDLLGSDSVAANAAMLAATLLPFDSYALLLGGRARGASSTPGFSSGTLCLGPGFGRFVGPNQVLPTGQLGYAVLPVDLTALPTSSGSVAANAGETWYFQCWYRDSGATAPSHFTDVASVTWR